MSRARFQRMGDTLTRRQLDCEVLLDQVHKPHNVSAIVRTADAVGIPKVYGVETGDALHSYTNVSVGSQKWVDLEILDDAMPWVDHRKSSGIQFYAAHFSDRAIDFKEVDYTRPCCIVLGAEKYGVSESMADLADEHIIIPMLGMVASLNVSVAGALIMYEMLRQRQRSGQYEHSCYTACEHERIRFEWMQPKMARYYQEKGVAYPMLDEEGDIITSS